MPGLGGKDAHSPITPPETPLDPRMGEELSAHDPNLPPNHIPHLTLPSLTKHTQMLTSQQPEAGRGMGAFYMEVGVTRAPKAITEKIAEDSEQGRQ